jgi:hypothetical protein
MTVLLYASNHLQSLGKLWTEQQQVKQSRQFAQALITGSRAYQRGQSVGAHYYYLMLLLLPVIALPSVVYILMALSLADQYSWMRL